MIANHALLPSINLRVKPVHHRSCVVAAASPSVTTQQSPQAFKPEKPTLFDVPISNNGARIRLLLYKKGLEDVFDIQSPATIGGLKSQEYLALNAQGKMPLLVLPDGFALPESLVIESYILDEYRGQGPDLLPDTPKMRAHAALVTRIHDLYIAPIQGCMYKSMDNAEQRMAQLSQIAFQLDVLEKLVVGPYFCGKDVSYADSALMPTFVFLTYILPRHFGWSSVFTGRQKLNIWWNTVNADPEFLRVIHEVQNGLEGWEQNARWEKVGIKEQLLSNSSLNWTCGC